jgi:hypothetical protein
MVALRSLRTRKVARPDLRVVVHFAPLRQVRNVDCMIAPIELHRRIGGRGVARGFKCFSRGGKEGRGCVQKVQRGRWQDHGSDRAWGGRGGSESANLRATNVRRETGHASCEFTLCKASEEIFDESRDARPKNANDYCLPSGGRTV